MAAPLQPFYVIKTEMPMGISESRCHFILAASVERRRSGYNNPTYTLCRLQKTQNLKFLQNLAGFWIFEFSMGISQTWYFNKYIHRINVAFVNRDTQNFQLILFWPKKAENNPKVLTQKKVHFMRSIFPKCKVRANFAFLSK